MNVSNSDLRDSFAAQKRAEAASLHNNYDLAGFTPQPPKPGNGDPPRPVRPERPDRTNRQTMQPASTGLVTHNLNGNGHNHHPKPAPVRDNNNPTLRGPPHQPLPVIPPRGGNPHHSTPNAGRPLPQAGGAKPAPINNRPLPQEHSPQRPSRETSAAPQSGPPHKRPPPVPLSAPPSHALPMVPPPSDNLPVAPSTTWSNNVPQHTLPTPPASERRPSPPQPVINSRARSESMGSAPTTATPPGAGGFSRPTKPPQNHPRGPTIPQHSNGAGDFNDKRATLRGVAVFPGQGGPMSGKDQKQAKQQIKKIKDMNKKKAKEQKKKEKEEAKRKAKEEEEKRKSSLAPPVPTNHIAPHSPTTQHLSLPTPGLGNTSPTPSRAPPSPIGGDPRKIQSAGSASPGAEAMGTGESYRKKISRLTKLIGGDKDGTLTGADSLPLVFTTADLFMWVREGNLTELRKGLANPPVGMVIATQIEAKSGDNLLHAAVGVMKPSEEIIKLLLKQSIDLNALNKSRLTPLYIAVMISAKPKIVSLLIDAGSNVDAKDGDENTLLHALAMHAPSDSQMKSLEKTLSLLIAKGANINAVNCKGMTPLMLAAYSSNMFSLLLKKNPDLSIMSGTGETVMHLIVKSRNLPSLGLLLAKNADPRIGTPSVLELDSTPQIKGLLLEKINELESGRVVIQRQTSAALLQDALGSGGMATGALETTAKAIKKELRSFNELMDALQKANIAELKKFLTANNYSPTKLATEVLNDEGTTSLHVVCSREDEDVDVEVVKYLLKQKGASVNCIDSRQWTPLHCCVFNNANPKIISILVSAGAEVNATTVDGTRPVDYYVRKEPGDWKSYAEALDLLIHEKEINIKNLYSGETCLHAAVRARTHTTRVVQLLLAKGADPNITNTSGESVLHYAVKVARPDLVEILVKVPVNTADPRKNSANGTPLDLAKQLPPCPEAQKIVALLEERLQKLQATEPGNPRELMLKKLGDVREQRKVMEEKLTHLQETLPSLQEQLTAEKDRERKLMAELEHLKRQQRF